MEIGIVGLPNAGKSTLFNALTRAGAVVASYPFTTIDPNIGVAALEDPRLAALAALIKPEAVVPATVTFVDIAGLVRGAHRGEGLGNQFLGHIRNVDAIVMVLRCFEDPDVPHVAPTLDPAADLATLDTELALADLVTVERRLEKERSAAKANPKAHAETIRHLEALRERLNRGERAVDLSPYAPPLLGEGQGEGAAARALAQELNLLTAKPRLLVANVSERDLPGGGPYAEVVRRLAAAEGSEAIVLSAQTEMELAEWDPAEAAAYREALGLKVSGLQALVAASYRLLDLITFFTVAGERVVRAWPIKRGTLAPQAAGKVHSDMERGFIRAEVIPVEALLAAGSWAAAREHGLIRVEGRTYVVQDGDVILFRFQV
jgi:GTP-binding protein YchF